MVAFHQVAAMGHLGGTQDADRQQHGRRLDHGGGDVKDGSSVGWSAEIRKDVGIYRRVMGTVGCRLEKTVCGRATGSGAVERCGWCGGR